MNNKVFALCVYSWMVSGHTQAVDSAPIKGNVSMDSQYLTDISLRVQDRLRKNELILTDLFADAGYSNGSNYNFPERRKVTEWISVFGKYKPEIVSPGFPYNKEKDKL